MLTIAFCYDLKSDYLAQGYTKEECLELDTEDTIDAVACALEELGNTVVRIGNIQSLIKHLANEQKPAWDLVFNIAEVFFYFYF
jgi:D-alanine-D-alanine ligase